MFRLAVAGVQINNYNMNENLLIIISISFLNLMGADNNEVDFNRDEEKSG